MHRINKIQTSDCQTINCKPFDLENQIWRELNLFLDLRYVRKRLKENFKDQFISEKRLEEKANNIQFCLKQAKDYINSAKYSSIITKPVLIYYSYVSFSTALIIFKKLDKTLNSMPESHGLSMLYPSRIGDNTKNQFLKISAKLNRRGLFAELSETALSDTYSLPIKISNASNASKSCIQSFKFNETNPDISEVDLMSLLGNISDIWKECRLLLDIENNIFEGQPILFNNLLIFKILKQNDLIKQNTIENKISSLNKFEIYESSNDNFFYKKKVPDDILSLPLIKTDRFGETFITADIGNNLIANDYLLQYLTFFILGSIARYKPDTWRIILEDNIQGFGEIPKVLCNSAFVQIPLTVLKELTNKHINIKN